MQADCILLQIFGDTRCQQPVAQRRAYSCQVRQEFCRPVLTNTELRVPKMSLFWFNVLIPALCGYILFVAMSGRWIPFRRPSATQERPRWLLGIWLGIASALSLSAVLSLAYYMPEQPLISHAWSGLAVLTMMTIPGLAVYAWYRKLVMSELVHRESAQRTDSADIEIAMESSEDRLDKTWTTSLDQAEELVAFETPGLHEPEHTNTTGQQTAMDKPQVDLEKQNAESDSQKEATSAEVVEFNYVGEHSADSDQPNTADTFEPPIKIAELTQLSELLKSDTVPAASENVTEASDNVLEEARFNERVESELLARETTIRSELEASFNAQLEHREQTFARKLDEANAAIDAETQLRLTTEKRLAASRKAMLSLESKLSAATSERTNEQITLEATLEEQIRLTSKAEAAGNREQQRRMALERELAEVRDETLKARSEIRKSTAARAKALASANKAVAFARKSVEARAATEAELSTLKDRLAKQQATTTSLIHALDTEKLRHNEEVAQLKAQIEHDQQMADAAVTGEPELSSLTHRLVRKVAKPRQAV